MGRIIHENNGKTTVYVSGEDIGNLPPITDTYYIGVDNTSGAYEKLNPNGALINLEAGSVSTTTYSDIVSLMSSSGLTPGTYYNISDFETIYDQPDYYIDGGNKTSVITKTSSVDPIVVLATSTNTLSGDAYRLNTPNDKLKYDWTFSLTEVNALPAKGRVTELIDSNDNRTDYDHTNVLFKRYQDYSKDLQLTGTITDYDCETGLVVGSGTTFLTDVSVDDIILIDTLADFGYNVGVKVVSISDDTNLYVTIDLNYSGTLFSLSSYNFYYGLALGTYTSYKEIYVGQSNENDYSEYSTFQGVSINNYIGNYAIFKTEFILPFLLSNNVLLTDSTSNVIGNLSYNNTINVTFNDNIIGSYFFSNTLDGVSFNNNIIGSIFTNNIIISDFSYNNIGDNFASNTVNGEFKSNNIGDGCQYNTFNQKFVDNNIGNLCQYNTFGINFGTGPFKNEGNIIGNLCQYNTFGDNCYGNVIGINCFYNTIGNNFISNKIGNYFGIEPTVGISNTILDNFQNNQIGDYFGYDPVTPGDGGNLIESDFTYNTIGNNFTYNVTYGTFFSNFIKDDFTFNQINTNFNFNKIGNLFSNNLIDSDFSGNRIEYFFYSSYTGPYFQSNLMGAGNFFNTIGQNCLGNRIGDSFIGNVIGDDFIGNQIGNNMGGFINGNILGNSNYSNVIGNYFQLNNVGSDFYDNVIGNTFYANETYPDSPTYPYFNSTYNNKIGNNFVLSIIGDGFTNNIVETDLPFTGQNFTTNLGNIVTISFTDNGGVDGTYTSVSSTGGTGGGATFDVTISGGSVTNVVLSTSGHGYTVSDSLTIPAANVGSGTSIPITVLTISDIPFVYRATTCHIFENDGGIKKLSYIDSGDLLKITTLESNS